MARENAALKMAYLLVANTAPVPHLYRQQQNLLREWHSILYKISSELGSTMKDFQLQVYYMSVWIYIILYMLEHRGSRGEPLIS